MRFLSSKSEQDVTEVGIMQPNQVPIDCLRAGEVGYLCRSINDVLDTRAGYTITLLSQYHAALAELEVDSTKFPIQPLPG